MNKKNITRNFKYENIRIGNLWAEIDTFVAFMGMK
jgi:hypothetical protein